MSPADAVEPPGAGGVDHVYLIESRRKDHLRGRWERWAPAKLGTQVEFTFSTAKLARDVQRSKHDPNDIEFRFASFTRARTYWGPS